MYSFSFKGRDHRYPGGDPRREDQEYRHADAGHLQGLRRQEGLQERGSMISTCFDISSRLT